MESDRIFCSVPRCGESIANHYWGKVKAERWTMMKDGTVFCPRHEPAWRRERREKRAQA